MKINIMKLKFAALLLLISVGAFSQNKIVLTAPRLDTSSLSNRINLKANTNLDNVNGVLSSTYGGAGSVSGILKANGSGVVSAAVAGTDYVAPSALSGYLPLSGGTLTGSLNGTSLSMSGTGLFNGAVDDGTNKLIVNGGVKGNSAKFGSGGTALGNFSVNDGTNINMSIKVGQTDATAVMLNAYNDALSANIPMEFRASSYSFTLGAATFSSSVTATNATLTNSTASTSTTTGALIVTGGVGVGGAIWAGSGFFESDERWKKINNRIASNTGIDAIRWTWNETHRIDERQHWGYSAQDVLKVLPEAVSKTKEGFYGVEYNSVFSYKIANLEKVVSELEQKLEKLEKKLEWYYKITKK